MLIEDFLTPEIASPLLSIAVSLLVILVAALLLATRWLKRLRLEVQRAFEDSHSRQLDYIQKLSDAVMDLQNRQKTLEGHAASLAQANMKLRTDLAHLQQRVSKQESAEAERPGDRFLH